MKIIPNWQHINLQCHFCGDKRSVKYTVWVGDGTVSTEVPCCNLCALTYDGGKTDEQR